MTKAVGIGTFASFRNSRTHPHMSSQIVPRADATALLVIDMQERLVPAMHEHSALVRRVEALVRIACDFGWPVVYSEQYPKGLGSTVEPIASALTEAQATRVEKLEFSLGRDPHFAAEIQPGLPSHLVVCGIEAHICVLQTAADLQARGHQVFVPVDAVSSRHPRMCDNGLSLVDRVGAVPTNVETILFQHLGRAGDERFRRLAPLIR